MPGGTKATHTMGLGIRLLAGMKEITYRELDIQGISWQSEQSNLALLMI